MAAIGLYIEDEDDGLDDGYGFDDGFGDDDESLGPLQRLEKYLDSENIFNRQMVARSLLDTLRAITDIENSKSVLIAMTKLSEDPEPSVRSELMEQVPHIAAHCKENGKLFELAVPTFLLPMVVKYLNDSNNQVRKTSQAALLVLLEQELVNKGDVEEQVVQVILELASPDSLDDHRTEAVALMSKMAPLLGKDITERLFLPRFCEMCTDPVFNVRKVCATNFGELCSVVGSDNSEKFLLSKFFYLCEDGVWGARKACAECFMTVACACAPEVRRLELANVFVNLLCDQSRWVRMAAFQQLGPFISTFADPNTTGLFINEEGQIFFKNIHNQDKGDKLVYFSSNTDEELAVDLQEKLNCENVEGYQSLEGMVNAESQKMKSVDSMEVSEEAEEYIVENKKSVEEERVDEYNNNNMQKNEKTLSSLSDMKTETTDQEPEKCDSTEDVSLSSDNDKSVGESNSQITPVHIHLDNLESFNSFQFWRSPLPEVDVDFDLVNGQPTNIHVSARVKDEEKQKVYSSEMNVFISDGGVTKEESVSVSDETSVCSDEGVKIHMASVSTVGESNEMVDNIGSTHVIGQQINESTLAVLDGIVQDVGSGNLGYLENDLPRSSGSSLLSEHSNTDDASLAQQQDIVPQSLLQNYLGMVDPSRAQTVDTEITRHCAYNLPAVAYTLGRDNWHVIRNLYETLTQDVQWKVRRTLAFSLHELALILGEDITHRDLVPVLDGFLKDLDEVRIGVLKHFADILRLLEPKVRKRYLTRIQEFVNTDNNRNWRFRFELAEQLASVCSLFSAEEIHLHIVPIAMTLASDKVSEVRLIAYRLLSFILQKFYFDDGNLTQPLVSDIIDKFAMNRKWIGRQVFAQICFCIMEDNSIPPPVFAREMLPSLLALGRDKIPNVRLALAKVLAQCIVPLEFFTSQSNPHHEDLIQTLQALQRDGDRDVRFFANHQKDTEISHHGMVPV